MRVYGTDFLLQRQVINGKSILLITITNQIMRKKLFKENMQGKSSDGQPSVKNSLRKSLNEKLVQIINEMVLC